MKKHWNGETCSKLHSQQKIVVFIFFSIQDYHTNKIFGHIYSSPIQAKTNSMHMYGIQTTIAVSTVVWNQSALKEITANALLDTITKEQISNAHSLCLNTLQVCDLSLPLGCGGGVSSFCNSKGRRRILRQIMDIKIKMLLHI